MKIKKQKYLKNVCTQLLVAKIYGVYVVIWSLTKG